MMKRSFAMLPGIGAITERRIWDSGIHHWDSFLEEKKTRGVSEKRKRYFDALLKRTMNRERDPGYLARFFPENMHWRLFPHLGEKAAFLDIETNGLSHYSKITVVGVYRNHDRKMVSLVRGLGLNGSTLKDALEGVEMIVTYNGSSFDLPFIRQRFPFSLPDVPHFDLRFAARRLGYSGGLKSLERQLGIGRDYEVENLAGEDALLYWKMWNKDRNRGALRVLRKYNREDVENLIPIADRLYGKMETMTLQGI